MADYLNQCRLCMTGTASPVDVFQKEESEDFSMAQILMNTFRIKVSPSLYMYL